MTFITNDEILSKSSNDLNLSAIVAYIWFVGYLSQVKKLYSNDFTHFNKVYTSLHSYFFML